MIFRHGLSYISLAVALLPVALGAVYQHSSSPPSGWTIGDYAISDTGGSATQTFTFALTLQNNDQLEALLLAVSTPGSPEYGHFLDLDEINAKFGPSDAAVADVTAWLETNGISEYRVNGTFVDFVCPVETANKMLNASYKYYTNSAGAVKLRTLSYELPECVDEHIALVDPGIYFGKTMAMSPLLPNPSSGTEAQRRDPSGRTKTAVDGSCQTAITPSCLKELYNVGDYTAQIGSGSKIGFSSFLNQSANYTDLAQFEDYFEIPAQSFSVELIAGGVNNQSASTHDVGEANLDVQNIIGIAHPLPVVEYITGGSPPFVPNIDQPTPADNQNEPYVPYYRYLLSKPNRDLPQVISNSYGDEEDSVPLDYAVLTCNMIGILGLRGITVLESSGDLGVGAGCLAPDNKTVEFNAIFPATCPYLTSVGGTVDVSPEIAWNGSSGGFSKYFPRPSYQDAAVAAYMSTVAQETYEYYGPYTNWKGRGFPDVAAHSADPDFAGVYAGGLHQNGGTSASAPVWAGLVGLLNDVRLRAGKSALGWLNPLVYKYGSSVLTDITSGYSVGCNGQNIQSGNDEPAGAGIVPGARWNATEGWDPVTGYGTPDFEKLRALVLSF